MSSFVNSRIVRYESIQIFKTRNCLLVIFPLFSILWNCVLYMQVLLLSCLLLWKASELGVINIHLTQYACQAFRYWYGNLDSYNIVAFVMILLRYIKKLITYTFWAEFALALSLTIIFENE